jgi:hypothetical protein
MRTHVLILPVKGRILRTWGRGGGGVKIEQNFVDVLYGWALGFSDICGFKTQAASSQFHKLQSIIIHYTIIMCLVKTSQKEEGAGNSQNAATLYRQKVYV